MSNFSTEGETTGSRMARPRRAAISKNLRTRHQPFTDLLRMQAIGYLPLLLLAGLLFSSPL